MEQTGLADELGLAVGRLARRIRQEQSSGLTPSQRSALASIERLEPVRLCDVAAAEGVTSPTLTKVVAALEEAGLVVRATDERDRRAARLRLTDGGRSMLRRLRRERTAFLRRQLDALSEADRARLADALPLLVALVGEAAGDAG